MWSGDYAGGARQASPGIRVQAAGQLAEQAAGQLAEQQPAGTGAVAGRTLTPSAQLETYVSGDADFHFVGGVSWRLRLHGAQGRRPQPLHGRSRLESLALALECPGRTSLEPLPYTRFPSWDSTDASASNRPAPKKPASLSCGRAEDRVRTGVGLVNNHYLASGGTYTFDSRVCV